MRDRIRSVSALLGLLSKRQVLLFGGITVLLGLSEAFGISMVFPILRFAEEGKEALQGENLPAPWSWIISAVTAIGLPITLITLLVLAFIPVLLRQVFHMIRVSYAARVQENAKAHLRNQGFEAIIRADLHFLANHKQGELISALTLEAHRGGDLVGALLTMMGTLFLFVVYGAILVVISPVITLVALLTALIASVVVSATIMPKSRRYGAQVSTNNNDMHTSLTEELSGARLVKMLGQEHNDTRKVARLFGRLNASMTQVRVLQGSVEAIVEPIFVVGLFGILYLGVEFFNMSLASLGTLVLVLLRMMPLAKAFNSQRQSVIAGKASLSNIQNVIREAHAARNINSGPVRFDGLKSMIEFDHVSFSYGDESQERWALDDVSFTVPRGFMTAIVGRSGAGKSTLVDLIPRLREATIGQVRIDGVAIQQLDLESLRSCIGYLSQETFLFNDSIRNNIAYGFPETTLEQIREAATRAYADGFVEETPGGYNSIVGDRGTRLSAGQRQRLGIARIMLQNPDIIILDEPTSALDSESEYYIQLGLNEIRKGKTFVVIAHRLSTIQQADQIIVLDKGRIIERGDHKVLLTKNGDYSRLFDLQIHV